MTNQHARRVAERYDLPSFTFSEPSVEELGSGGGFSGAQLWKLNGSTESFCLRRWPNSHPNREILTWIHLVLSHAKHNDCPFVAAPIRTIKNETFTTEDGSLWEIAPWMLGAANFNANQSEAKLANMMEALARFHLASAQVSLDFRQSTNVQVRLNQLNTLGATLEQIHRAPKQNIGAKVDLSHLQSALEAAHHSITPELLKQLPNFAAMTWPVPAGHPRRLA